MSWILIPDLPTIYVTMGFFFKSLQASSFILHYKKK